MLSKVFKIIKIIVVSILALLLVYMSVAVVCSLIPASAISDADKEVEIFIETNGVHSDIVLPVRFDTIDWSKKVPFSNTISKDSVMQYISFGWGDKGFYLNTPTWADLRWSTALKAASGVGNSALHVTFLKTFHSSGSFSIKISKRQYLLLVRYIEDSFAADNQGQFIVIDTKSVYGKNDAFYEANGSYSILKTCNTWTNTALKTCEQKACLWTPFDKGIFYQYGK